MCGPEEHERVQQVDVHGHVPVPHMVHGLSSAPSARCTAWECTMCGPGGDLLEVAQLRRQGARDAVVHREVDGAKLGEGAWVRQGEA